MGFPPQGLHCVSVYERSIYFPGRAVTLHPRILMVKTGIMERRMETLIIGYVGS